MNRATVVFQALSKRYDGVAAAWALRDTSATIYSGEVTMLMGPSGSGKTTLLSLMGGLLAPTAGHLCAHGVDLSACDESRRQRFRRQHVGFIFQSYNLLSALTARENVGVALALRCAPQDQALELLERVGLASKANAYPHELSGGQRQRVAIARALAGNPPILLADEPTAALDAAQGRRVMNLLRDRAHRDRQTVLVVTHDPRVREYADRVLDMEDGRITRIVRRVRPDRAVDAKWLVQKNGTVVAEAACQ